MKFNITEVSDIKVGDLQITKRMFGTVTIWQNIADFDYVFYEYKDFLALPERKVQDTGDLYPEGFDGVMHGSTFVVPGAGGISYPVDIGTGVAINPIYINIVSNALDGTSDVTMNTVGYTTINNLALVDSLGDSTAITLSSTNDVGEWYDADGGIDSGDDSSIFRDEQMFSYAYATNCALGTSMVYTFKGLDNAKTYTLEATGCKIGSVSNNTVFSVSGYSDQAIPTLHNTTLEALFETITPTGGEISITISPDVDNGAIYVNGLILTEEI